MGIDNISSVGNNLYNNIQKPQPITQGTEAKKIQEAAPAPEVKKVEPKVQPKLQPKTVVADSESRLEENIEKSQKVRNRIAEVNSKLTEHTKCEFSYHEDTKRVSIKVINSDTDEVIREIPPEEALDMLSKMWEVAGILVDESR